MSFSTHDLVEIETVQFRAMGRVREIEGKRLHLALEQGSYVQWTDEPVVVRRVGEPDAVTRARLVHVGPSTLLLEIVSSVVPSAEGTDPVLNVRDTQTDE